MESMGGSIWHLAAEHIDAVVPKGLNGSSDNRIRGSEENDSDDEGNSSSSDSDDEVERKPQRVALACEDGVVRIFEVGNSKDGLVYRKSFPRVKGNVQGRIVPVCTYIFIMPRNHHPLRSNCLLFSTCNYTRFSQP